MGITINGNFKYCTKNGQRILDLESDCGHTTEKNLRHEVWNMIAEKQFEVDGYGFRVK